MSTASILLIGVSALAIALVAVVCARLDVYRKRRELLAMVGDTLRDRPSLTAGVVAALAYAAIFFVFGGKGGRIHVLYGRWIFTFTASDVVVAAITAVLVGLAIAMFWLSSKRLGLFKAGQTGVGIAGTLLALLASFCP